MGHKKFSFVRGLSSSVVEFGFMTLLFFLYH